MVESVFFLFIALLHSSIIKIIFLYNFSNKEIDELERNLSILFRIRSAVTPSYEISINFLITKETWADRCNANSESSVGPSSISITTTIP